MTLITNADATDEATLKFRELCASLLDLASKKPAKSGKALTKNAIASQAGNLFEQVAQYYLSVEPHDSYVDSVVKVIPFTEWAEGNIKWGRSVTDQGIDFIIETEGDEKVTPVQVKFSEDASKNTSRVKFDALSSQTISKASREIFNDPILVTNAQDLSKNLQNDINRLRREDGIRVKIFLEDWFVSVNEALADDGKNMPTTLEDIQYASKSATVTKTNTVKVPRPYQAEAAEHAVKVFQDADATTFHMACGTGKTLAAWATYQKMVQPGEIGIIFVPALSLIDSTIRTFRAQQTDGNRYDILAVCSDITVNPNDDSNNESAKEFDIDINAIADDNVTSDAEVVQAWVNRKNSTHRRLLVATYQSSEVVAEAVKDKKETDEKFPFLVADEAHRLVTQGNFGDHMWSVPVAKRLFMTATPTVTVDKRGKRNSDEVEARAMDDASRFGAQDDWYRYTTAEAVSQGYLSDYSIEVLVCNADEREAMHVANNYEEYRFSVFAHAGMKVLNEEREGKGLTVAFMSSIKKSKGFIDFMSKTHPEVKTVHIDGSMSVRQRTRRIKQIVETGGVISNVRVLNEGIDIPELNAIMFCDPKGSKVDTIQAFGRPLRLDPDNPTKTARIILPIILKEEDMDDNGDFDMELSSPAYRPLWNVMRALHDNGDSIIDCFYVLNDPLLAGKTHHGRQMPMMPEANREVERIQVDTMMVQFKEKSIDDPDYFKKILTNSVVLKAIVRTEGSWKLYYDRLATWLEKHDGEYPSAKSFNQDECKLAGWVGNQRKAGRAFHEGLTYWGTRDNRKALEEWQVTALEQLPNWTWGGVGAVEARWRERLSELKDFVTTHDGKYPKSQSESPAERRLWQWIDSQRSAGRAFHKGLTHGRNVKALEEWQVTALEQLPNWTWSSTEAVEARWRERLSELKDFITTHDGKYPKSQSENPAERNLGSWVVNQRAAGRAFYKGLTHWDKDRKTLEEWQVTALEQLPNWTWGGVGAVEARWRERLSELKDFVTTHEGKYPRMHSEDSDEHSLAIWVHRQRARGRAFYEGLNHGGKDRKALEKWQVTKLEQLPNWTWGGVGAVETRWRERLDELKKFITTHDGKYPRMNSEDPVERSLGAWVVDQRACGRAFYKGLTHWGKDRKALEKWQVTELEQLPNWTWSKPRI